MNGNVSVQVFSERSLFLKMHMYIFENILLAFYILNDELDF